MPLAKTVNDNTPRTSREYVEVSLMWDPKDRLDADMKYAVRIVQAHCATPEQAALMCGVEVGALQAQLSNASLRTQVVGSEKASYALDRYLPGAF